MEAENFQLRVCIIGDTAKSGHCGFNASKLAISSKFCWDILFTEVTTVVPPSIHFLSPSRREKIQRPYGVDPHGTSPNDLLLFDFIDVGPKNDGSRYILILQNYQSIYCGFFAFKRTSGLFAAQDIIDWCAAFSVLNVTMSDCSTHFKNATMKTIEKGLKTFHHFIFLYYPCNNGGIERVG